MLERGFSAEKLLKFQKQYSVSLPKETQGLVVIKTASKTKAQSRKAADANWKVSKLLLTCVVDLSGKGALKKKNSHSR